MSLNTPLGFSFQTQTWRIQSPSSSSLCIVWPKIEGGFGNWLWGAIHYGLLSRPSAVYMRTEGWRMSIVPRAAGTSDREVRNFGSCPFG